MAPAIGFGSLSYTILDKPLTQIFAPFTDSISASSINPAICGLKVYTVKPALPFVKIHAPESGNVYSDDWNFEVSTSDLADAGTHQIAIEASLLDFPDVPPASFSFNLVLINPCLQTSLTR